MPLAHTFKTLRVNQLIVSDFQRFFQGNWQYYETVHNFSYTFEFGKSYLLDAKLHRGAWAISWLIGGLVSPAKNSKITIDGEIVEQSYLRSISWCVSHDGYEKRHPWINWLKNGKTQILEGLEQNSHTSLKEVQTNFLIRDETLNRNLKQLSGQKWRVSPAIGYAKGRIIYCFPHLNFFTRAILKEYGQLWFKDIIQFLTDEGALVLIPAIHDEESEGICDVVVPKSLIDSHYQKIDEA